MARPEHLYVFCYDVTRDASRNRVHDLLEEELVAVQKSVFEGRLTLEGARRLVARASNYLAGEDSLRVYCVTSSGFENCFVVGANPLPEAQSFFLF